jgi:uncharacterized protein (DUF488 family)
MPASPFPAIYTIGHSNRSMEEFVALLREARVSMVVDVRKIPRSRSNPQYNLDRLPDELRGWQIRHEYIAALGGRRSRSHGVPAEVNGFWQNQSFHNYADYALSEPFVEGLERLLALSAQESCAIMCAEAVWWRCHRRLIADHLIARGRCVRHILAPSRIEEAKMTSAAVAAENGLTYPAEPPPDHLATGDRAAAH